MEKPKTFHCDLAHLPPALLPLTEQPRWVVWPWELRINKAGNSKWTKPPRQARNPSRNAKSNDPDTWGIYGDAVATVAAGNADGIGFMLKDSNIGAIDLDRCVDRTSAKLELWAERLHDEAINAYQEITVSGGGMRIIGTVNGPETHRRFTFDRKTGAGVELYRNTARYITISGIELGGPCSKLPSLDAFIDRLLSRHTGQAGHSNEGLDFNDAGPQSSIDYDDLIRNGVPEGQRSEAFQAVVWHLANRGLSAEQIVDELAKHPNGIGAKYADRLHDEVSRSRNKWRRYKRAAATGSQDMPSDLWPQIFIKGGELPRVVDEAEEALLLLGREIYQRGGLIVRPVQLKVPATADREIASWRLIPVSRPYMVETLTCAAQFFKYDGRVKGFVAADAPDIVAETYLSRQGRWRLPMLAGIVHTPFLRADGSLCEQPGYDAESGLLFKPDGRHFPLISQQPGKADALQALALIDALIETFPFATSADRAVALSAIFTTLDRRAMATAPLHAFTSPTAGTGKSLLVDMVALLATGRPMPVISQGRNEEELEKRLGAALLAGDVAISLDNCDHIVQSALLCQALTQRQLNIRLLGLSKNIDTPVNAAIFATGNNLVIAGDLTRRTLLCSLDARCERPELRKFDVDALKTVQADRGRLVAAALTVLRAWHVARSSEHLSLPPLGGFEEWSQRIREPLVWLGAADPCDTIDQVRQNDPKREALYVVVLQWQANLSIGSAYTVQEIIGRAVNNPDFYSTLLNVAGARTGAIISNERLGRWLRKVEGKVVSGFSVSQRGRRNGYPLWSLVAV